MGWRKEGRKEGRMAGWLEEMNEWWEGGRKEQSKEGWKEWKEEGTKEGWMNGWMKEGRKDGWMEQVNEWMNEWIKKVKTARNGCIMPSFVVLYFQNVIGLHTNQHVTSCLVQNTMWHAYWHLPTIAYTDPHHLKAISRAPNFLMFQMTSQLAHILLEGAIKPK